MFILVGGDLKAKPDYLGGTFTHLTCMSIVEDAV
jgi:hypothetical protein